MRVSVYLLTGISFVFQASQAFAGASIIGITVLGSDHKPVPGATVCSLSGVNYSGLTSAQYAKMCPASLTSVQTTEIINNSTLANLTLAPAPKAILSQTQTPTTPISTGASSESPDRSIASVIAPIQTGEDAVAPVGSSISEAPPVVKDTQVLSVTPSQQDSGISNGWGN